MESAKLVLLDLNAALNTINWWSKKSCLNSDLTNTEKKRTGEDLDIESEQTEEKQREFNSKK